MSSSSSSFVLFGPTASGKTALAVALAARLGAEIISADSRQVYRGMDLGTGKDLGEYGLVPYHLIDIRQAGEQYSLHDFQLDFWQAHDQVVKRGRPVILCGGSGLYIRSLLAGFALTQVPPDEAFRAELDASFGHQELIAMLQAHPLRHGLQPDTSTKKRTIRALEILRHWEQHPPSAKPVRSWQVPLFGLCPPVEQRRQRITLRLHQRLEQGLVAEVQHLLASGLNPEQLLRYGLEYKYITLFLTGQMAYAEMLRKLEMEIHRFAKRQMTFFRMMERSGTPIYWLPWEAPRDEQVDWVLARLGEEGQKE